MSCRVLLVDDDAAFCQSIADALSGREVDVVWRTAAGEARQLLRQQDFECVLVDLQLAQADGLELCREIVDNRPDLPVIVVTAFGSQETAVAAIRAGAYDFVTKPIDLEELALAIDRAVKHRALEEEVKRLRRAVKDAHRFDQIIGSSAEMEKLFELLTRVADTDATVLITGESGTGKELVARALHKGGGRANGPFVAVNCAALPESLLESELFGHVKGAFTDAREARAGLLVQASGGTLFLDEIGEMPLAVQAKLLRALQERTVRPLGGDGEMAFDSRIIVSTNRDLETEVEQRRFRSDLFYRINVVRIHLPPLRARGGDALALAQHFLEHFAQRTGKRVLGIMPAAAERLMAYRWPGNIRELANCMERAVALAQFEQIGVDDLPDTIRNCRPARLVVETEERSQLVPLAQVERRYVLHVLERVGGKKTLAAQILGMDRRTLYRKLEQYAAVEGADGEAGDRLARNLHNATT